MRINNKHYKTKQKYILNNNPTYRVDLGGDEIDTNIISVLQNRETASSETLNSNSKTSKDEENKSTCKHHLKTTHNSYNSINSRRGER